MPAILGINAYHADSAACLVIDGVLVAAAEEERFRRVKHWAGFPARAVAYCLEEAGLRLGEVDAVAVNSDPRAHRLRKLRYLLGRWPRPGLVAARLASRRRRLGTGAALQRAFPGETLRGPPRFVEHHLAHLGSAFLVSPFEQAAVVSVDGFGDFCSTAWGRGTDGRIAEGGRVYFPHSLGIFYESLTRYLGFRRYGDEYKVMGLAAWGEPRFLEQMRELVELRPDGGFRLGLGYFHHHRRRVEYRWDECEPAAGDHFSAALERLLGPRRGAEEPLGQRHRDIASSVQRRYEEALFHLLNALHARCGSDCLALAGGCALNSVANGRIREHTPFRRVWVQPAAGDAGGALGAAFTLWQREFGGGRGFVLDRAGWGPAFGSRYVAALLQRRAQALAAAGCGVRVVADEAALCAETADAIAAGAVVGWFQGRMEWGPRALGNRSILCDPRRAEMREVLNRKIKRRESFRPFAPSVLREAAGEWFETDAEVPFMTEVVRVREACRARIPAVTHVDGSGRLHTVTRAQNPRYHRLIERFAERTGVPVLLNTSFNENEPVVCRPEEALECFLRTRMDVLVLGEHVIERRGEGT